MELSVCIGSSCHIKGAYDVIQTFQREIENRSLRDKINFKASFCMKNCQNAGVAVLIDDKYFDLIPEKAKEFFTNEVLSNIN
jgi:NADH:ubiquinone oxidoreductase subunit E